jgi:formylglycine-generating enzyme required for sulfatase activity
MTQSTRRIILAMLLLALARMAATAETLTVTRSAVVRAGPHSRGAILATVTPGETFDALEARRGWYRVVLDDGREGWIGGAVARVQSGRGAGAVPTVVPVPTLMPAAAPLVVSPAGVAATSRTALVIGNAAYKDGLGALKNPVNDAADMAVTLRQLGFIVTLLPDANQQRMDEAIEDFSRQLHPGSVGVFYYSGHGAQSRGRNYLIPVGSRITTEAVLPYQAIAAEEVLARMESAGQGKSLNIMILDACRNAPFMRGWRSPVNGLAPMHVSGGSLIAYATAPGAVAKDGAGRNGTYTKHLLQFMREPNLPIELMFKQVRVAVEQDTNGEQSPWEMSSLRQDFAFNSVAGGATPSPAPAVEMPTRPVPPGPSEPTRVAVGLYPQAPQTPPATIAGQDGAEMVLVPAGEFLMGSDDDEIDQRHVKPEAVANAMPRHRVSMDAFYIDQYEVTNALFQQFVHATGYRTLAEREGWSWVATGNQWEEVKGATWRAPRGPRSSLEGYEQYPVVQVSHEDAKAYCAWAGKRLPTEAEWEKAARGTDGRLYPWGNEFDGARVNFCDRNCQYNWKDPDVQDGYRTTAPVGRYADGKSPYGAYDMAGNVWEWVADWYEADYYGNSPARNPRGPASGEEVVRRGGGWSTDALHVRTSRRGSYPAWNRSDILGIRCARGL